MEFAVFAAAALILSWNLWNVGIASGYIDPVMHFGAQDERSRVAVLQDEFAWHVAGERQALEPGALADIRGDERRQSA